MLSSYVRSARALLVAGALTAPALGACDDSDTQVPPTPFVVCARGVAPTFASIQAKVLAVSCGTGGSACHSSEGALFSGELDLETDAYRNLLGPDGKGAPANNIEGDVTGLLRVAPGNPDASFLVTKLVTTTTSDAHYGAGMPFDAPGDVCPETLAAIRTWIAAGAGP